MIICASIITRVSLNWQSGYYIEKRDYMKKIKPLLFASCLLLAFVIVYTKFINAESNKTTYVVFGDSIAAGYGLDGYSNTRETPPSGSYQSLVGNFLKTTPVNYAVTGDDSDDLIGILGSGKADKALSEADVITISIGSNDLLKPFTAIVQETLGLTDENGNTVTSIEDYYQQAGTASLPELLAMAGRLSDALEDNDVLHGKAQEFSGKFGEIIKTLKEKAPQAGIYVTNIYNPYKDVTALGNIAESYIQEINKAFDAESDDYTLIDVYSLFKSENLTNVKFNLSDLSDINLDPHPSAEGHKKIASAITDALNKKYAPSKASITKMESTARNSITINLSCKSGKSGYEIRFAKSKNGKFNVLKTTYKNKNKFKLAKLKSGKTYFFKARCYNNVNGVKYYGSYSKIKKIKIK